MNEEKKLDESSLEAVSGGLEFSTPFADRSPTSTDSPDQVNGRLVVDGNKKP